MRKQKTIFDLFREKDSQFAAEPSKDAWSKLEKQLDGNSTVTGGKMVRFNKLSIAAGMLLLVGLTGFLFTWLNQSAQNDLTASAESSNEFFVEELQFSERNENEWSTTEEYRARFASYAIKEEKGSDKNLALNKTKKGPTNVSPKKVEPSIAHDLMKKKREERVDKIQNPSIAHHPSESSEKHVDQIATNSIVMEDAPLKYERAESIQEQSIKTLSWLVGDWEAQKGNQKSVENWVADSSNTISGTGYLVQEDDTVFTEQMVIKQIGEKIYLFQNIESASHKVPFELIAQADTQWIFENADVAHPNQIILSNGGPANYQMKMKNLIPINTDFLKQRNHFKSNAALRQMRRVN